MEKRIRGERERGRGRRNRESEASRPCKPGLGCSQSGNSRGSHRRRYFESGNYRLALPKSGFRVENSRFADCTSSYLIIY